MYFVEGQKPTQVEQRSEQDIVPKVMIKIQKMPNRRTYHVIYLGQVFGPIMA